MVLAYARVVLFVGVAAAMRVLKPAASLHVNRTTAICIYGLFVRIVTSLMITASTLVVEYFPSYVAMSGNDRKGWRNGWSSTPSWGIAGGDGSRT